MESQIKVIEKLIEKCSITKEVVLSLESLYSKLSPAIIDIIFENPDLD